MTSSPPSTPTHAMYTTIRLLTLGLTLYNSNTRSIPGHKTVWRHTNARQCRTTAVKHLAATTFPPLFPYQHYICFYSGALAKDRELCMVSGRVERSPSYVWTELTTSFGVRSSNSSIPGPSRTSNERLSRLMSRFGTRGCLPTLSHQAKTGDRQTEKWLPLLPRTTIPSN